MPCTVPFNRGSEEHTKWYKHYEELDLCMKAVEKELDRHSGEAGQDFIEFKTLCAEAALNKYDSGLVAKSIRLLIDHKEKPWVLSEAEAGSDADIVISWPTQEPATGGG